MSSTNNGDEVDGQGSESSSWNTPSDPCPNIDRAAIREETRDATYNPCDEVTSQLRDHDEDASSSAQEEIETTAEVQRKRKQGERGGNRWPDHTYSVTEVGPKGEPLEPIVVRAKFRNAIGFLVRDMLDITIEKWDQVPLGTRKLLWKRLKTKFIFRTQSRGIVKKYAMRQFGISFRGFRSELTTKYVRTGLELPEKYKNISSTQWKTFVEQRNTDEFLAKSETNSCIAKKNIYNHHLGTGGYYRKIHVWEAEEAERKKAKLPRRFEDVDPRGRQWLLARKPKEIKPGCFTWKDPLTNEVAKNILAVAAQQKEGSFKPARERDALTVALGNPEHPGRVRGLSSRLGWKEGFPNCADMYRKRDRYKEAMRDCVREEAKKEMTQMLVEIMANPDSELRQQLSRLISAQQGPTMQQPEMITQVPEMQMVIMDPSGPLVQSSSRSAAYKEHYAVDDIVKPSACSLVISYGITNVRTLKVATGLAIPGRIFHGDPIPNDYTRVEVSTVVEGHMDDWLDMPTKEGIQQLGQAINEFILWPRRDIRLDNPIPSIPTCRPCDEIGSSQPFQNHASSQDATQTPYPSFIQNIPSRNSPPAPEPPQSFSLNLALDPLSNPPTTLPKENPPLSQKDTLQEPRSVVEGEPTSVPEMSLASGDNASPHITKKWLNGNAWIPQRGKAAASASKKTIQNPTKEDYEIVPEKYLSGRPMLHPYELICYPSGMKKLHDWYMRASSVQINAFNVVVPPLPFLAGPLKIPVDFEDIWLMFRLDKLELQLVRVWCLMQISDQEIRFTKDPFHHKGKKVGYLDPFLISEHAHTLAMGTGNDLFLGKTEAEIAIVRVEEQDKKELAVVTYITNMFLEFEDRSVVCAPYMFMGHWICMYIYLYDARVLVLDSADFPVDSYKKFIDILNRAYGLYKMKGGRYDLNKQNKPLHVRTNYQCHKQPPGSMHCGYYVCEFLRDNGRYLANPKKVYKCADASDNHLLVEDLLNICNDMCWFIMKETLHIDGKYFDVDGELANPEYYDLIDMLELSDEEVF